MSALRSFTATSSRRWLIFLILTFAFNLAALILFPMFVTDALTPPLAVICGVPAFWGLYTLLCFRTRKERLVGYLGIAAGTLWAALLVSLLSEYGWHTS